jgi:hypothetical protein
LRSSFESLHHLFCHVTEVPTAVTIFRVPGTNVTGLGTFWNLPTGPPQAWTAIQHHLIRY